MVRPKLPHLSVKSQYTNEKPETNQTKTKRSSSPFTKRSSSPFRSSSPLLFKGRRSPSPFGRKKIDKDANTKKSTKKNFFTEKKVSTSSTISTATTAIASNHLSDILKNKKYDDIIINRTEVMPFISSSSIEYISLFTFIPDDIIHSLLDNDNEDDSISSNGTSTTCPTITSNTTSSINATTTYSAHHGGNNPIPQKDRVQYSILQYRKQLELNYETDYPFRNYLLYRNNKGGDGFQNEKSIYSNMNELQLAYNSILYTKDYKAIYNYTKTLLSSISSTSSSHTLLLTKSSNLEKKNLSQILYNLSILHTWEYNFSLAIKCIQECLYLRKNYVVYEEKCHDIVLTLCELGFLQYAREQYTLALSSYREALQTYYAIQQPTAENTILPRILNNISCIHYQLQNYKSSHTIYNEGIHLLKKKMNTENDNASLDLLCQLSIIQSNLSFLYYGIGDCVTGVGLLEEAFIIQESIFEDDHFIIGCSSYYLELMNDTLTNTDDSLDISNDTIDTIIKVDMKKMKLQTFFGNEDGIPFSSSNATTHPIIQLGPILQKPISEHTPMQRIHETLFSYLKEVPKDGITPILKKTSYNTETITDFLLQNPELHLYAIYNYVFNCTMDGKIDQAIYILKKVQYTLSEKYTKNHPLVALLHHNIGMVYAYTKQYKKALKYFQHCLMIQRKLINEDQYHPNIISTLTTIGMIYYALENYDLSLSTFNYILSLQRKIFGYNSILVSITLNNIACIQYSQQCYTNSFISCCKSLEESIDIIKQADGDKSILGQVYLNYGFIRIKQNKYDDAIVILQDSLQLLKECLDGEEGGINQPAGDCFRHGIVWYSAKVTIDNLAYSMALANHNHQLQHDDTGSYNEESLETLVTMYSDMLQW